MSSMSSIDHQVLLTSAGDLDALPLQAIVLNLDCNPHAWQKRLIFEEDGNRSSGWFVTTDSDWPVQPDEMLRDHESFIVLWLPTDQHASKETVAATGGAL